MILLTAALLFFSISITVCFFLCMFVGKLTTLVCITSFICGAVVSACFLRKQKIKFNREKYGTFEFLIIFFFILFCSRQFLWIFFEDSNKFFSLNGNNLGDLPLHLTYIQNFVKGASFWPMNPIYSAEQLHYPYGVDLLTAMFVKLNVPQEIIFPLMGMGATFLTMQALLWWGKGFALASFLFSGGLASLEFFSTGVVRDYLGSMAWKNIILTLFVPQRGFLLAFSIGLVLLWSWRRRFLSHEITLPRWVEGLLWGALPLIHFHTFLFMSVIFAIWSIAQKKIKEAVPIFLWAVIPATVTTLCLTDFFRHSGLIWIKPGWMIGEQNFLYFFIQNYGLFIPLVLFAAYRVVKSKNREYFLMLVPAMIIYLILLFVMFAPWEWDNTKLMVWCYLLGLPAIYELVVKKIKNSLKPILYFWLFFSGFISLASYFGQAVRPVEILSRSEVDSVCQMLREVPIQSVFATMPTYNHPVSLCGYKIVAGYGGHLWSHGIKSSHVEQKLKTLMMGEGDWRSAAKEIKARYLYWGAREKIQFSASTKPWEQTKLRISENEWGQIYDLGEQP